MMNFNLIITTDQLYEFIDDPNLVIIDCRYNLTSPEWGFQDYKDSHIPGAIFADLNKDLSSPITSQSGRHPLPNPDQFIKLLSIWGISQTKQVVVYDTVRGAFAARLWWMLKAYGFDQVSVLDGGFTKWATENKPTKSGIESGTVVPMASGSKIYKNAYLTTEEMEKIYNNPDYKIIDARNSNRFLGNEEPIDAIAGHIPGAMNRFHALDLTPAGIHKTSEELRTEYLKLLAGTPTENVVLYCGSGVTSCFNLLSMHYAGLPGAKLYVGSWSEWIRNPNHPVAIGE